jgi:hypothetical protein|tara:strand:- start:1130 stop:1768 length:639 start_codon:yes stop_codon:yes gene_type:complete
MWLKSLSLDSFFLHRKQMSGSTRFDDGSQGEKDVGVDFTGRASFLVSSSSSSSSSPVFSVWIVNKSGGLIFYKNYSSDKNTLDINDTLRLASVWHSLHAISRTNSVSPVKKSSGIELLETSTFDLHCFETKTGIKFMVCSMKKAIGVERLLRRVYDVYADFAMKNPFYELEQPIQAELFEERVMIAVKSCRNANSGHYSGGGGGGGYASSLY